MDILHATLQDLKTFRPDLCEQLYDEFLAAHSLEKPKKVKKAEDEVEGDKGVKVGDVLHWYYTKEEGTVVGFDFSSGRHMIIVRQYDGTKIYFENDPKLYKILEGKERDDVLNKRKQFLKDQKEKKNSEPVTPKHVKKARTIYDGIIYKVPTRKGSKLKIGDRIRIKLSNSLAVVKGFVRKGGLDRVVIDEPKGTSAMIIDNAKVYDIIDTKISNGKQRRSIKLSDMKKERKQAMIGDLVMRTSDKLIGRVVEIRDVGYGIEKLILELDNGSQSGVFNDTALYYVLE